MRIIVPNFLSEVKGLFIEYIVPKKGISKSSFLFSFYLLGWILAKEFEKPNSIIYYDIYDEKGVIFMSTVIISIIAHAVADIIVEVLRDEN